MYEPLRITAWLQCGVASDWTLPLDGIMFYQACRSRWGAQDATIPGAGAYRKQHGNLLPIKRVNAARDWYYRCSFAQWPPHVAEGVDHWNKRFDAALADLIDFGPRRRGRVIVEGGRYRAYHMMIYYRHALFVRWYAVGEQDGVRQFLSMVTNVGKKTDQGWGRVLRWQVEPWPEDWSIHGPGGRLMRAIPAPGGELTGIRPPYWQRSNQADCQIPPEYRGELP